MLIAKAAMQKLLELEGKAKAGKETHRYWCREESLSSKDKQVQCTCQQHTKLADAIKQGAVTTRMTDYFNLYNEELLLVKELLLIQLSIECRLLPLSLCT
jgi:hypothetical protein